MQNNSGQQRVNLTEELLNNFKNYSFIQVIRILAKEIGEDYFKYIKIKPYLSLSFPPNDVISITKEDNYYIIEVSFFGLYGASSPLPTFYTEELIEEQNIEKSIKRDFIDIFNKRIYEFYFENWLKTQPSISLDEFNNKKIELLINSFSKNRYIFANMLPISTFILKELIKTFGYKKIEIEEFINSYTTITDYQTTKLSTQNNILGEETHLGKRVKHCNKFRIIFKEMKKEQFLNFLKDIKNLNKMFFTMLKSSIEWEYKVEFIKKTSFNYNLKLGVNAIIGEVDEIIIKDMKW